MQKNIYFNKNLHQVAEPGSQHAEIGLIGQLAACNTVKPAERVTHLIYRAEYS
jgi:hypothetical protein